MRASIMIAAGMRFGKWTVLELVGSAGNGRGYMWRCRCECGQVSVILAGHLRSGHSTQCRGCGRKQAAETCKKLSGMLGQRFGHWTVESRAGDQGGEVYWECRCDCGQPGVVSGYQLRKGESTQCVTCGKKEGGKARSLPGGRGARNQILFAAKTGAKERGLVWGLDDETFDLLSHSPCHYCGCPPSQIAKGVGLAADFIYNGIDRKDNGQGYTKENSVACCWTCNWWKRDLTEEAFIAHAMKIVLHQQAYQGRRLMDHTESLDMDTMLEVTKIADCLERVVARLQRLGSNPSVVEPPSLEALEHLPRGIAVPEPAPTPFSSAEPKQIPIAVDLEEAGAECRYCAARLDEILKKWMDATEGEE